MLTVRMEQDTIEQMVTNTGESIGVLSNERAVMLVFLRHFGCIFCREALAELSKKKQLIEDRGVGLVFVHMASDEIAESYFSRYNLAGSLHVSDPICRFYSAFGLVKGSFTQLFGLKSWIRGFQAGVLDGHGVGAQLGDGFQMPGVFVVREGKVVERFVHKLVSDRPDYIQLAACCTIK